MRKKYLNITLVILLIITMGIVVTACGDEKEKNVEKEAKLVISNESDANFAELKLKDGDGKEVVLTKEKLEKNKSKDLSKSLDEISKLKDNVKLMAKLEDGTVKDMVEFPTNGAEKIRIKNNGDVFYLEYKPLKSSKTISTESKEIEIKAAKDAENKEKDANDSVNQTEERESSNDGGGSQVVNDNSQSQAAPAPASSAPPAQPEGGVNQDGCITDGILN